MSDNELEIIAKQNVNIVKKKHKNTEALKFIREFGITTGNTAYKTNTIYYVYTRWRKTKTQERKSFITDFGKILKVYKKGKYRYSNLSNFPENLMAESLTEERRFLAANYKVRHGKKKAKKKKLSSTKSICK
jgi:hypothetical protein